MIKRLAAIAALLLLLSVHAAAADATSAWDSICAAYHFKSTLAQGVTGSTTFAQAYTGPKFADDFAGIIAEIGCTMGATLPDPDGDEAMAWRLANWPNP